MYSFNMVQFRTSVQEAYEILMAEKQLNVCYVV